MRFHFEREKTQEVKRKHGVSLQEAQEIFDGAYLVDQKSGDPERFRAIGWRRGLLCSVILEVRHYAAGEFYHLVTAWKATKEEVQSLCRERLRKPRPPMRSRTWHRGARTFRPVALHDQPSLVATEPPAHPALTSQPGVVHPRPKRMAVTNVGSSRSSG